MLSSYLLFFALTPGVLSPISAVLPASTPLDLGYRQMYDLQFKDAHTTFQAYMKARPDDPFGATSDAAAYLFDEFNRLGVLQSELFTDNERFEGRAKPSPDPGLRAKFDDAIGRSQGLADVILKRSPRDRNALLASVLNVGLDRIIWRWWKNGTCSPSPTPSVPARRRSSCWRATRPL